MNDSGSTRPDRDTNAGSGDAEVFVPPARQAEEAAAEPDTGSTGADDLPGDNRPPEPPTPLPGYEHV